MQSIYFRLCAVTTFAAAVSIFGCRGSPRPAEVAPIIHPSPEDVKAVYGRGPDARARTAYLRIVDSTRRALADSISLDQAPRRVRVRVINEVTGGPLRYHPAFAGNAQANPWRTTVTDSAGEFLVLNPPIGGTMLGVLCRSKPGEPLRGLWERGIYVFPAIDTTVDMIVPGLDPCWVRGRPHPFLAGWLESAEARDAVNPTDDEEAVYLRILEEIVPSFRTRRRSVVIGSHTRTQCRYRDWCSGRELARLVRAGEVDSVTGSSFRELNSRSVPLRPGFGVANGMVILTPAERDHIARDATEWMDGSGFDGMGSEQFWRGFRARYPVAAGIASFSQVGFNPEKTQALEEFRFDTKPDLSDMPKMILLQNENGLWRIVRRDITDKAAWRSR